MDELISFFQELDRATTALIFSAVGTLVAVLSFCNSYFYEKKTRRPFVSAKFLQVDSADLNDDGVYNVEYRVGFVNTGKHPVIVEGLTVTPKFFKSKEWEVYIENQNIPVNPITPAHSWVHRLKASIPESESHKDDSIVLEFQFKYKDYFVSSASYEQTIYMTYPLGAETGKSTNADELAVFKDVSSAATKIGGYPY